MVSQKNSIDNTNAPIAILGAGSWGTALALHLARLGQIVHLWTPIVEHLQTMQVERTNHRYLPDYYFPDHIQLTEKLSDAVTSVQEIVIAVPSQFFASTCEELRPLLKTTHRILSVTKGLDQQSGRLLDQIAEDIFSSQTPYAVLSGPSFAREVAQGLPTAVVIASKNEEFAKALYQRFDSPSFRVQLSHDIMGVEIGGIVKNVIAIATGIFDGMQLGANARSALMTRGVDEMMRLGLALGGQRETFTGLAGLGDLILTCTDNQSRNRRFGLALGQGKPFDHIQEEIGQVVEGAQNATFLLNLARAHHTHMPITEWVHSVLQAQHVTKHEIDELMETFIPG